MAATSRSYDSIVLRTTAMEKTSAAIYLAVAAASAAVFLNSLHGEFVFDDLPAIRNNADVDPAQTSWNHVFESNFWGQPMGSQWSQHLSYRPFTTLTFRFNYSLHGYEPFGYHLVNLICHVVASLLVTKVARVVFGAADIADDTRHFACIVSGLLFATHPVHTEAVSNLVCRAELLACIFYCLSFIVYSTAAQHANASLQYIYIVVAALCAVVSMLCKEQGIMVLPCCIIFDLFVVEKLDLSSILGDDVKEDTSPKDAPRAAATPSSKPKPPTKSKASKKQSSATSLIPSPQCLARIALTVALTAVIYQWRVSLNKGDEVKNDEKTNPANHIEDFLLRALTKNYYVFLHFWLLLVPVDLCCDWSSFGVANIDSLIDRRNLCTFAMYAFLGVFGLFLLLSNATKRGIRAAALVGLAMMAINFIPASGLLVETGFVVAERILYLPSIGFCLATAAAVVSLFAGASKTSRRFLSALLLIVFVVFFARTWLRNYDWENEASLYKTGLEVLPNNAKLHHNYARAIDKSRLQDQEFHYRSAIRIYPPYGSAYINLGVIVANDGRLDEAVNIWKQGLEAWSKRPILGQDPVILNLNIGTGLKNLGRFREAVPYLEKCLQLSPGKPNCQQALNIVRAQLDRR